MGEEGGNDLIQPNLGSSPDQSVWTQMRFKTLCLEPSMMDEGVRRSAAADYLQNNCPTLR